MSDARGVIVEFEATFSKFVKAAGKPGQVVLEVGRAHESGILGLVGARMDVTFEGYQTAIPEGDEDDDLDEGQTSFDEDVSDEERARRVEAAHEAGADPDTGEEIPLVEVEDEEEELPEDLTGASGVIESAQASLLWLHAVENAVSSVTDQRGIVYELQRTPAGADLTIIGAKLEDADESAEKIGTLGGVHFGNWIGHPETRTYGYRGVSVAPAVAAE